MRARGTTRTWLCSTTTSCEPAACVEGGINRDVVKLFDEMTKASVKPDDGVYYPSQSRPCVSCAMQTGQSRRWRTRGRPGFTKPAPVVF
jgi:hypothetical protein